MKARTRLLRLQRAIYEDTQESARTFLEAPKGELAQYSRSYYHELRKYEALATQRELVQKASQARIILCGDYHTLSQAQRTVIRLLRILTPRWKRQKRNVYLALEMLKASHTKTANQFIEGEISEEAFLEKIGFQRTWGFSWENYRRLFDFAKKNRLESWGISSGGQKMSLPERDTYAAQQIRRLLEKDPTAVVVVVMGEYHLTSDHLPKRIESQIGSDEKVLVIHQNVDRLYWQLAEEHAPFNSAVVRVRPNVYCVLNTPPWLKLKSHLQWAELSAAGETQPLILKTQFPPRDESPRQESYEELELSEEIHLLLTHIGKFLKFRKDYEDSFQVVGPFDFGFLKHLEVGSIYQKIQLKFIKRCLTEFESHFLAAPRMIYLSSLSLNHAASQAAILLHSLESESSQDFCRPSQDFYPQVWIEALGFLGSKIINPQRKCNGVSDLEELVLLAPVAKTAENQKAIRLSLEHISSEKKSRSQVPMIADSHFSKMTLFKSAKLLGQILGNAIYLSLAQNLIHPEDVRLLFQTRFLPKDARKHYFDWIGQLDQWNVRNFSKKNNL